MSGLIVIEIVPQAPVDAMTFQGYLTNLQVKVFDLSFTTVDDDPPGVLAGTASYLADSGGWNQQSDGSYTVPVGAPPSYPGYSAATTSGIVQQVDFIPLPFGLSYFRTGVGRHRDHRSEYASDPLTSGWRFRTLAATP